MSPQNKRRRFCFDLFEILFLASLGVKGRVTLGVKARVTLGVKMQAPPCVILGVTMGISSVVAMGISLGATSGVTLGDTLGITFGVIPPVRLGVNSGVLPGIGPAVTLGVISGVQLSVRPAVLQGVASGATPELPLAMDVILCVELTGIDEARFNPKPRFFLERLSSCGGEIQVLHVNKRACYKHSSECCVSGCQGVKRVYT